MDDDKKLKILMGVIIIFSAIALIGVWEAFIQPFFRFIFGSISIG